jgi:outer membrane protein TolC
LVTTLLLALIGPVWAQDSAQDQRAALAATTQSATVAVDGTLAAYVRLAVSESPQVRAAYAEWEAQVRSIRGASTLPEPTVGFGLFVRSVETRVGPQQARVSVQQALPWPTELIGRHDVAVSQARASQARLEAVVLAVSAQVAERYWTLWELRANQRTHAAHLSVLEDLSETLRARMAVGAATLADLQQVDLSRARLEDALLSLDAREERATAQLRAALGGGPVGALPTSQDPPVAAAPALRLDGITDLALQHPLLDAAGARQDAADAALVVAKSQRAPGLALGADWIPTGPAVQPELDDSGRDAVMVGVGVRVPLWQASYADDIRAASAMQAVRDAESDALQVAITAQAHDTYLRVTDGARRVGVVRSTLLPQAEGTYDALLGSYAVGDATVAQVLLANRDLLELQVLLDQEQAALERAWAELEQLCGTQLERVEP